MRSFFFILFCTFFTSIVAFVVPHELAELNNSVSPSVLKNNDTKCNLKDFTKTCKCPMSTTRNNISKECEPKHPCTKECGYGICTKSSATATYESCRCFEFALLYRGKCVLYSKVCEGGKLHEDFMTCKCEDQYIQADDKITCKHKCSTLNCQNNGNCTIKNGTTICVCPDQFSGDACETDKCSQIKCKNGGKCVIKEQKAVCKCANKYTGRFCQIDLTSLDNSEDNFFISFFLHKNKSLENGTKFDFKFGIKQVSNLTKNNIFVYINSESVVPPLVQKCSRINCQNGGECYIKNGNAVCNCSEKFSGDFCERDRCSLINCQNNGKCEIINGKAVCNCPDKYTGTYCELSKCSLIKCQNGGKCEIENGKAVCACQELYTGDYCETGKCSLMKCQNSAKCEIKNLKAVCTCQDKYAGEYCEIDKCLLIKCQNGGECHIKNGKAVCVCNDRYLGSSCEIDKCNLINCLNGGKCNIINRKVTCICKDKFTGEFCEKGTEETLPVTIQ